MCAVLLDVRSCMCTRQKRLLLKELWLFYVIQGDFYEAYHLYKDEIQGVRARAADPQTSGVGATS